jgi:hypothetical protein
MFKFAVCACVALMTLPVAGFAQSRPMAAQDDSIDRMGEADIQGGMTDAQTGEGAASLADVFGPIAFGVVNSNGVKQSGTGNWSSSYNATYSRYEITITGENYYYLNYATLITPAGDIRFCRSDSVNGKLLVYCYNNAGAVQPARFGFTTFKPS